MQDETTAVSEEEPFHDLLARVRRGDPQAAESLVRRYEPEIRLRVRTWLRLRSAELRRVFDSMDICQSVMANFFLRASAGQYDLESPDQLMGLLVVMARHKLSERVRHQQSRKRDIRRSQPLDAGLAVASGDESPSQLVAFAELQREFQRRLSDDERVVAEARSQGHDWAAIAGNLGGTPEGRRKQYARAVDRVARELGI